MNQNTEGLYKQVSDARIRLDALKQQNASSRQVGGIHYQKSIQPWDAMESWMGENFSYYLQGNVIKYIARYRDKNGVEDLKKAQHYLEKLIEVENGK